MDDMTEKIQSILNDEESMKQIMELARMFGAAPEPSAAPEAPSTTGDIFSGLNPAVLMQLSEAFTKRDASCCLIEALKPFLSEEKKAKADRAIKLLRLYNVYIVIKDKGLLNGLDL